MVSWLIDCAYLPQAISLLACNADALFQASLTSIQHPVGPDLRFCCNLQMRMSVSIEPLYLYALPQILGSVHVKTRWTSSMGNIHILTEARSFISFGPSSIDWSVLSRGNEGVRRLYSAR